MDPNHNGLTLSRVGKTFRAGTRHARTAPPTRSRRATAIAPRRRGAAPIGIGRRTDPHVP